MKINESLQSVKGFWNRNPVRGMWTSFQTEFDYILLKERVYFQAIDWLPLMGSKVLDVGCGTGIHTYYMLTKGANVTGVDISEVSVKMANKKLKDSGFDNLCKVGNAEQLPFQDETFDCVVSIGVLHHTYDIRKAVKEIHRVIKPGGEICILVYKKFSIQFMMLRFLRFLNKKLGFFKQTRKDYHGKRYETLWVEQFFCPIVNTYTSEEIKNIFREFYDFSFHPSHTGLTRLIDFVYLPLWFHRILCFLDEILAPIFGSCLIFYATKE